MEDIQERFRKFSEYASSLKGDEKGEAQVFLDRLFQAYGHAGYKEAGATLEHRVRVGRGTRFADLFWEDRVLIEMKKRRTNLRESYKQAFNYWVNLTPNRPRYVVLCNFDEFYIYDFDLQVNEPVDILKTERIFSRHTALNFLSIEKKTPVFKNNLIDVTKEAADKAAQAYSSLVARGEDFKASQRFILQCIFCMFAEDYDLLPSGLFSEVLVSCRSNNNCFEMLNGLFRQMDSPNPAKGGQFKKVPYFNGGLFSVVDPVEMNGDEIDLLIHAAEEDWSKVKPEIFGTLFQNSMGKRERHAYGAHFTSEADIYKIVMPTIVNPWEELVSKAKTLKSLELLLYKISKFKVLDPACGSGNFLYVSYRELKKIESEIIEKIYNSFSGKALSRKILAHRVGNKQFFGIDNNSFAVELARVTLILAKEISVLTQKNVYRTMSLQLPDLYEKTLPLDNIDGNIVCEDALFVDWPDVDAIVGNPPYQSKNKMQQEFSPTYMNKLREKYPEMSGRADYCVYWFRKAHDQLKLGQRAGLVGTNTIRQTYSRESGLDYIVANEGVITDAVSSQVWSGDAKVHVSIVNWIKGEADSIKQLKIQKGDSVDSPWELYELATINSSLAPSFDVSKAEKIKINSRSKTCFQGQTHGHKKFLLSPKERRDLLLQCPECVRITFPYLTIDNLLSTFPPAPKRFVIDFSGYDIASASTFKSAFKILEKTVLRDREAAAVAEKNRNDDALKVSKKAKVNFHHRNFFNKWWQLSYPREDMLSKIKKIHRYVSCGQVTKRPVFEFISSKIRPNAALMIFAFQDDYSFGVLQSFYHWEWFLRRCSTFKRDFRYTSTTVYDTFPWPQQPEDAQVIKVARASRKLRIIRNTLIRENQMTYRDLYRNLELPGKNKLRDAHEALDEAVRGAYGFGKRKDQLQQLFELNHDIWALERQGNFVRGPGVPEYFSDLNSIISDDCITV